MRSSCSTYPVKTLGSVQWWQTFGDVTDDFDSVVGQIKPPHRQRCGNDRGDRPCFCNNAAISGEIQAQGAGLSNPLRTQNRKEVAVKPMMTVIQLIWSRCSKIDPSISGKV